MEDRLYYLCNEMILILQDLEKRHIISREDLDNHLKIKVSFLKLFNNYKSM